MITARLIGCCIGAAASLGVTSIAQQAVAAEYLITFSGVVSDLSDATGYFGTPGESNGEPLTVTIYLQTGIPGTFFDDVVSQGYSGGSYHGTASPLRGSVSIDGQSLTFNLSYNSFYNNFYSPTVYNSVSVVGTNDPNADISIIASVSSQHNFFETSDDLTAPLDYSVQSGDMTEGYFQYTSGALDIAGEFAPTRVVVGPSSGAPEPASWATMLAGFAGVGAAIRARRSAFVRA